MLKCDKKNTWICLDLNGSWINYLSYGHSLFGPTGALWPSWAGAVWRTVVFFIRWCWSRFLSLRWLCVRVGCWASPVFQWSAVIQSLVASVVQCIKTYILWQQNSTVPFAPTCTGTYSHIVSHYFLWKLYGHLLTDVSVHLFSFVVMGFGFLSWKGTRLFVCFQLWRSLAVKHSSCDCWGVLLFLQLQLD